MSSRYASLTNTINRHGLDTVTSELLKQAGEPYPQEWNLKTAALTVTLKMASNREAEHDMFRGLASLLKVMDNE